MTIVEPIPDLQWGKGAWKDYIDNWRTRDTSWMQERLILRYASSTTRNTDWPAPQAGQVIYNDTTKVLEMWRSGSPGGWARSLMFQNLISTKDDSTGVSISHLNAAGKGISFGPTSLIIDLPTTNYLSGLLTIDSTGLGVKTGSKTAKLSTDTANLVSDSPIKAPSIDLSGGTGTVLNAAGKTVNVGTLNADSATINTITLVGTLTGGVLNGTSGTIGSVTLSGGQVGTGSGATGGMQTGQGHFYGDANSAVMRQRPASGGVWGGAYVQALANDVVLNGSLVQLIGPTRVMSNRSLEYSTNNGVRYGGPVIWGGDPGVGNVPEGTIWAY